MPAAFNYIDAVNYVCREKSAAYAFIPTGRGTAIVGGAIYIIAYNEFHNIDPNEYPKYNVYYMGGLFHSSSGEEETYLPEDVPEAAQQVTYKPTKFDTGYIDYEIQIALKLLEGKTLEEALSEE